MAFSFRVAPGARARVTGRPGRGPAWAGPPARESRALELVEADRQAADALAREREDGVAHRGRGGRHPGLTEAARGLARVEDVHLDLGRLVDPQHLVVVEVGLLHAPAVEGDLTVKGRGERVDGAALHLRLHLVRIDGDATVD